MKLPKIYRRPVYDEILERAHEQRRFIQVLAGPRQVGKTTLARQVMDAIGIPGHFASADAPDPEDIGWIYTQWAIGRQAAVVVSLSTSVPAPFLVNPTIPPSGAPIVAVSAALATSIAEVNSEIVEAPSIV